MRKGPEEDGAWGWCEVIERAAVLLWVVCEALKRYTAVLLWVEREAIETYFTAVLRWVWEMPGWRHEKIGKC